MDETALKKGETGRYTLFEITQEQIDKWIVDVCRDIIDDFEEDTDTWVPELIKDELRSCAYESVDEIWDTTGCVYCRAYVETDKVALEKISDTLSKLTQAEVKELGKDPAIADKFNETFEAGRSNEAESKYLSSYADELYKSGVELQKVVDQIDEILPDKKIDLSAGELKKASAEGIADHAVYSGWHNGDYDFSNDYVIPMKLEIDSTGELFVQGGEFKTATPIHAFECCTGKEIDYRSELARAFKLPEANVKGHLRGVRRVKLNEMNLCVSAGSKALEAARNDRMLVASVDKEH